MDIKPYAEISDSERMERDWQAEQRAEARFLRETYNDWHAEPAEVIRAEHPPVPVRGEQLNLFEEAAQ